MKIYVASSWRNGYQPDVVQQLRGLSHEVYDFRNPSEGDHGFQWSAIDQSWQSWSAREYIDALDHPVAVGGFASDYEAMLWADCFILVMPCGRSAHLELGWAIGAGKPTYILLNGPTEPELMYKLATGIYTSMDKLLKAMVVL